MKLCRLAWLLFGALLFALPPVCAEDAKPTDEAKEAEEEDKALAKLPGESTSPLKGITLKGLFTLQPSDEEKPVVIGAFKGDKQTYLVKPDNDDVRQKLLQNNGKTIMVYGKERNKGKYLIVMNVFDEPEPPANRRKKKGF